VFDLNETRLDLLRTHPDVPFSDECLRNKGVIPVLSADSTAGSPRLRRQATILSPSGSRSVRSDEAGLVSGYSGADCSLPADQPPTAQALIGGESCDVRARPCRRVGVMASNISDEGTLTCRITFLDVSLSEPAGNLSTRLIPVDISSSELFTSERFPSYERFRRRC